MPNQDFPFKLGADPEFNMIIDDKHFCASSLMEVMFKKILKEKGMGYEVPEAGVIGWDGNDDIAEIRPNPENSPAKLTDNIKKLIKEIVTANPLLELSTLCDMGTVGGHIHFELEKNITSETANNISRKLGSFYLPIILSEDRLNLRTRSKGSYGKLTDFRVDNRGTAYTFEFRAPSAEWMTTEKITNATLAYLGTVYNELLKHPKNFANCNSLIFKNQNQANALRDLAISDFNVIMQALTDKIRKYIKTFEYYPQYKDEIDFILSAEKVSKEKQAVNYNIAQGWGMVDYKLPTKRQLFSRAKQNKTDNRNLDNIAQLIPLTYNQDINVAEFSNALKLKIARFNWKLNNHYFLFGLKKGIDDFIVTNKNFEFLIGHNQIQTKNDFKVINNVHIRMNEKFPYTMKRENKDTTANNKKYILIGIPYDTRIKLETRKLIELIYNIEKNKSETIALKQSSLPENVINKEKNAPTTGIIYDIYYSNRKENPESEPSRMSQAQDALYNAQAELTRETERVDIDAKEPIEDANTLSAETAHAIDNARLYRPQTYWRPSGTFDRINVN